MQMPPATPSTRSVLFSNPSIFNRICRHLNTGRDLCAFLSAVSQPDYDQLLYKATAIDDDIPSLIRNELVGIWERLLDKAPEDNHVAAVLHRKQSPEDSRDFLTRILADIQDKDMLAEERNGENNKDIGLLCGRIAKLRMVGERGGFDPNRDSIVNRFNYWLILGLRKSMIQFLLRSGADTTLAHRWLTYIDEAERFRSCWWRELRTRFPVVKSSNCGEIVEAKDCITDQTLAAADEMTPSPNGSIHDMDWNEVMMEAIRANREDMVLFGLHRGLLDAQYNAELPVRTAIQLNHYRLATTIMSFCRKTISCTTMHSIVEDVMESGDSALIYSVLSRLCACGVHLLNDYPLRAMCLDGNLSMVQQLIGYGADIRAQDGEPIRLAAGNGDEQMVRYLLVIGQMNHRSKSYHFQRYPVPRQVPSDFNGHGSIIKAKSVLLLEDTQLAVELLMAVYEAVNGQHHKVAQIILEHMHEFLTRLPKLFCYSLNTVDDPVQKTTPACVHQFDLIKRVLELIAKTLHMAIGKGDSARNMVELLLYIAEVVHITQHDHIRSMAEHGDHTRIKYVLDSIQPTHTVLSECLQVAASVRSTLLYQLVVEFFDRIQFAYGNALIAAAKRGSLETVNVLLLTSAKAPIALERSVSELVDDFEKFQNHGIVQYRNQLIHYYYLAVQGAAVMGHAAVTLALQNFYWMQLFYVKKMWMKEPACAEDLDRLWRMAIGLSDDKSDVEKEDNESEVEKVGDGMVTDVEADNEIETDDEDVDNQDENGFGNRIRHRYGYRLVQLLLIIW